MKRSAVLLLALALVGSGCHPPPSEPEPENKPAKPSTGIEGKWVVVSSEVEGKPSPEDATVYTRMTFLGEDVTLEGRTQKHELRSTLDTTQQPMQITLYSKEEKVRWKGIYRVEGTSLRLSYGPPNGERPTRLDTSKDAKAILYVLERETP